MSAVPNPRPEAAPGPAAATGRTCDSARPNHLEGVPVEWVMAPRAQGANFTKAESALGRAQLILVEHALGTCAVLQGSRSGRPPLPECTHPPYVGGAGSKLVELGKYKDKLLERVPMRRLSSGSLHLLRRPPS